MRHGSLFSGIGGFDLASEWMGWENVFHCEWNEFGQKVLKYYWPKAISYYDITKTDFSVHRGAIDIITGGFPCQPYSMAGKRLGKEDKRHLWPEMLRCIREVQPTWIVGENVLGLVSWNEGLVFHEVQADLEAEGYEVQPYVLPAVSVNAPHRRDRVWFVAYSKSNASNSNSTTERPFRESGGIEEDWSKDDLQPREWREETQLNNRLYEFSQYATNSECKGLQGCTNTGEIRGEKRNVGRERNKSSTQFTSSNNESNDTNTDSIGQVWEWEQRVINQERERREQRLRELGNNEFSRWEKFPISAPICTRDDGFSDRLDNITFSKWRNESIKAGGNAIVPQVVYQIFKTIEQYNNLNK